MLKPGASITADFSADEINEAAQENVLEVKQEQQQIEPPQHEDTPPTPTPTPTQKPIYKNADIQAAIKRREKKNFKKKKTAPKNGTIETAVPPEFHADA